MGEETFLHVCYSAPERDWAKDWELCEKATPGPWYAIPHPEYTSASWRVDTNPNASWAGFGQLAYMSEENARFVAEARDALPYWLKWVRKLTACLEDILWVCRDAGPAASRFPESECRALLREIDQVWCRVQRELAELEGGDKNA